MRAAWYKILKFTIFVPILGEAAEEEELSGQIDPPPSLR